LGVGAQPSEKVAVLIKKYGTNGTHVDAQKAALEMLAQPKAVPDPGAPASLPTPKGQKQEPTASENGSAASGNGEPVAAAAGVEATNESEPSE
jgi:small subunit ribosomal protein S16